MPRDLAAGLVAAWLNTDQRRASGSTLGRSIGLKVQPKRNGVPANCADTPKRPYVLMPLRFLTVLRAFPVYWLPDCCVHLVQLVAHALAIARDRPLSSRRQVPPICS